MDRIGDAIDERLEVRRPLGRFLGKPVPEGVTWYHCFGGLTFFTFIVLVVTGVVLAFFYVPSPDHARASVAWMGTSLPFGALVRNLHRWSAYAMVVLVVAHMVQGLRARRLPQAARAQLGGRRPDARSSVLAFGFTGYLLPWDQKAYWATNVGINMAGLGAVHRPLHR